MPDNTYTRPQWTESTYENIVKENIDSSLKKAEQTRQQAEAKAEQVAEQQKAYDEYQSRDKILEAPDGYRQVDNDTYHKIASKVHAKNPDIKAYSVRDVDMSGDSFSYYEDGIYRLYALDGYRDVDGKTLAKIGYKLRDKIAGFRVQELTPIEDIEGYEQAYSLESLTRRMDEAKKSGNKKALDALKKEYYNHPLVLKAREEKADDIESSLNEIRDIANAAGSIAATRRYGYNNLGSYKYASKQEAEATARYKELTGQDYTLEDGSNYEAAIRFLENARKTINAPGKYDDTSGWMNILRGAGDKLSDPSFWEFGIEEVVNNLRVRDAFERMQKRYGGVDFDKLDDESIASVLSDSEQALVGAFAKNLVAQIERSEDASIGYNSGKMATESLKFMAEFILTGGVGKGATAATAKGVEKLTSYLLKRAGVKVATKAVTRAATRASLKVAGRKATTVAAKAVGKLSEKAVTGLTTLGNMAVKSTVQGALMPSSYKTVTEHLLDIKDNGQLVEAGEAIWKGVKDAWIETFSENAGEVLAPLMDMPMNAITFGKWGEISRHMVPGLLKDAGFHGYLGEIGEEILGAAMRTASNTDPDAWKDFWKTDNLLTTAISFAPMSIFGLGTSTIQRTKLKKNLSNSESEVRKLLESKGYSSAVIDNMIGAVNSAVSVEEVTRPISTLINEMARQGNTVVDQQVIETLFGYADAAAKWHSIEGALENVNEGRRKDLETLISSHTAHMGADGQTNNTFWMETTDKDGNTTRAVREILQPDGSSWYVLSSDANGRVIYIDADGKLKYTTEEAIAKGVGAGRMTDYGVMEMTDYLDTVLAREDAAEGQRRVSSDSRERRRALIDSVNIGDQINTATTEAPNMVNVVSKDNNGMVVQDENGDFLNLTWEEYARSTNQEINAPTDEEVGMALSETEESTRRLRYDANRRAAGTPFKHNGANYTFLRMGLAYTNGDKMTYRVLALDENGQTVGLDVSQEEIAPVVDFIEMDNTVNGSELDNDTEVTPPSLEQEPEDELDGEKLPTYVNERGERAVDQEKLWNDSPEKWAEWNDRRKQDDGEDSVKYVERMMSELDKQIADVQSRYDNETNPNKRDAILDEMRPLNERKAVLQSILDNYQQKAEARAAEQKSIAEEVEKQRAAEEAARKRLEEDEERVKEIEARVSKLNTAGVQFHVYTNPNDIPANAGRAAVIENLRNRRGVLGWTTEGEDGISHVHIFAPSYMRIDNWEEELSKTILHELIQHVGVKRLLGSNDFIKVMDSVWNDLMDKGQRYDYSEYVWDVNYSEEERRILLPGAENKKWVELNSAERHAIQRDMVFRADAADEFSAHLIEEEGLVKMTWFQRFWEWVKNLFGKGGFKLEGHMTINDMARLWALSENRLRRAEKSEGHIASEGSRFRTDVQGNMIDESGRLVVERISSIDELTDDDFLNPSRSVELPTLPENVANAIRNNGKPVVIKKNIFEKNKDHHNFTPEKSREILSNSLYNTNLVGQSQPQSKPKHWVAIRTAETSAITVLEVNDNKENTEIVGWFTLDQRNLNRIKRQAEREGGELLILSSDRADSLSTLPVSESSATNVANNSEKASGKTEFRAKTIAEAEQVLSGVRNKTVGTDASISQTEEGDDEIRFRIGRKRKEEMTSRLDKRRPDLSDDQKAALFTYLDALEDTKAETAVFNWFVNGKVNIPDDNYKVDKALEIINSHPGIDVQAYESPMDLISEYAEPVKEATTFDPSTKSYLTNPRKVGDVTVYDMADDKKAAKDFCETVMQQFYETSPWCLMTWGNRGEWTGESMWNHYNTSGRGVAFDEDGKPVAFMSSDEGETTWWDETDSPHKGIPVSAPIEGDELGRSGIREYDEKTGEMGKVTKLFKGSKKNGVYEEWDVRNPDVKVLREVRKHHKLEGYRETWFWMNGVLRTRSPFKNGVLDGVEEEYSTSGDLVHKAEYKDGKYEGVAERYDYFGNKLASDHYHDDQLNGVSEEWSRDGTLLSRTTYKDGERTGVDEQFYSSGQINTRANYKNGELNGISEKYDEDGTLVYRDVYKDGYRLGPARKGDENTYTKFRTVEGKGKMTKNGDVLEKLPVGTITESGVRRSFAKNGYFDFTGSAKVKTEADVAYIFRNLENYAIENSFVVLVKNGKPTIVHTGMGSIGTTTVDLSAVRLAYEANGADAIYMVHNHPSGNLRCSMADVKQLTALTNMFPDGVVKDGIIIDTTSGNYGSFNTKATAVAKEMQEENEDGTDVPMEILSFDRQVFSKDFEPMGYQIAGPDNVAAVVSSHRLGERDKVSALIVNRSNQVIGNIHTVYTSLSEDIAEALGNDLVTTAAAMGGQGVILYGRVNEASAAAVHKIRDDIKSKADMSLLDVVNVRSETEYESVNDGNLKMKFRASNLSAEEQKKVEAFEQEVKDITEKAKKDGTFGLAPNGEKSNLSDRLWAVVRTSQFKKWFGDWMNDPKNSSKVVDENGEPLQVYHGGKNKFFEFDDNKVGENKSRVGGGFYFTNVEREASAYGKARPFFLNIKDPLEIHEYSRDIISSEQRHALYDYLGDKVKKDRFMEHGNDIMFLHDMFYDTYFRDRFGDYREALKAVLGIDGVINNHPTTRYNRLDEYITLDPSQIKSVDNSGLWDKDKRDIRFRAADVLNDEGAVADPETESVRFSVRYIRDEKTEKKLISEIAKFTGRSVKDVRSYLDQENSLASQILSDERLDFAADENETPIKDNSDYAKTVDFTNICKKRRMFTDVTDRLMERHPNISLTAPALAEIRRIMSERGEVVNCGLCYVEGRRQKTDEVVSKFIEDYKNGTLKEKAMNALDKNDTYVPTKYDLITVKGRSELKKNHPGILNAFTITNNARGMQSVRVSEGEAEYTGQILSFTDANVKKFNKHGGLRLQSFSDFEAHHLLDLLQVITDASAKGLKIQAYTKVPEFAWILSKTGVKVNRSLIAKGKGYETVNGKEVLTHDPVEGIDTGHEYFKKIGTENPNIGQILVGISDHHIELAMADPTIDFIIPYHASGISHDQRQRLGTGEWTDYTKTQNERVKGTDKKAKENINIYDIIDSHPEIENAEQFVNLFLEECEKEGLEPRFSQFLDKNEDGSYRYRPGYEKFLVDYKMFDQYDENKHILPQETVVPDFEQEAIDTIVADYKDKLDNGKDFSDRASDELVDEIETSLKAQGVRFRFIGEKGAAALDLSREETRLLDGITIAREMDENGNSAESIKLATGWEKGVDGQWRYEEPDGKLRDNWEKAKTLDKLIDDERLFKTYPDLKKVKIGRSRGRTSWGSFCIDDNTLRINVALYDKTVDAFNHIRQYPNAYSAELRESMEDMLKGLTPEEWRLKNIRSTVVHEVQHIIQKEEGFATGSQPEDVINDLIIDKYGEDFVNYRRADCHKKNIRALADLMNTVAYSRLDGRHSSGQTNREWLEDWLESFVDTTHPKTGKVWDSFINNVRTADRLDIPTGQNAITEIYKMNVTDLLRSIDTKSIIDYKNQLLSLGEKELYYRAAGEVEARNVSARLNMSEEERRRSLASETEDRRRDEQLVFYNNPLDSAELELVEGVEAINDLSSITNPFELAEKVAERYQQQKEATAEEEAQMAEESAVHFRTVTNPLEVARLESGEKVTAYRAMALVDGRLYPPMASKKDGSLRDGQELGNWVESEPLDNLDELYRAVKTKSKSGKTTTKYKKISSFPEGENHYVEGESVYFKLEKNEGDPIYAAYNPYMHLSSSMMNDQFKSSQTRNDLVVVRCEFPASELTSGYKAYGAKDAVGAIPWNSGVVNNALPEDRRRQVYLSRWCKIVDVVPTSEVADEIWDKISDLDLELPSNVFSKELRTELEKRGAKIYEADNQGKRVDGKVRFRFSNTEDEFRSTQREAEKQKGLVTPGLQDMSVTVLKIDGHPFSGDDVIGQAKTWTEENGIVGKHSLPNGGQYEISKKAVKKYLSESATNKSDNLGIQVATLMRLPDIINESIDAEVHPDYKKGLDGVRGPENGIGRSDLLVHRLYGAINHDGVLYRVKTTMYEYTPIGNKTNTPHSYEVTKIEVLDSSNTSTSGDQEVQSTNKTDRLSATKLLNGIEKSYDSGKKLLGESKVKFRAGFYEGGSRDDFDDSLFDALNGSSAAFAIADQLEGYYGGEIKSISNSGLSTIQNGGLLPYGAGKYDGHEEEYHHIEFEKDGETFVETVPFFSYSELKERGVDIPDDLVEESKTKFRAMPIEEAEKNLSSIEGHKTADNKFRNIDFSDMEDIRFRIGKARREQWDKALAKKRPDLTEENRNALFSYLDTLEDSKLENVTFNWFAKGTIILPEDMEKVRQAVEVSEKAKVDPLQYSSPMELMNAHSNFRPNRKAINPDEVSTLKKQTEMPGYGVTIYYVDESPESQQNMREIINTHWGEDANPWCLLQGDGKGNLSDGSNGGYDARYYWAHYNKIGKRVAFKDGKLLAFSANDRNSIAWWDRNDTKHSGIPLTMKMPNDELGRTASYEISEKTLNLSKPQDIHKGTLGHDGVYSTWDSSGVLTHREGRKNGNLHGEYLTSFYPSGTQKGQYKDGVKVGEWITTSPYGTTLRIDRYNDYGELDGDQVKYDGDGDIRESVEYKDGEQHGRHRKWSRYGELEYDAVYVNGNIDGLERTWWENGEPRFETTYANGYIYGISKEYDRDGNLVKETEYNTKGEVVREQTFENPTKFRAASYEGSNAQMNAVTSDVAEKLGVDADGRYLDAHDATVSLLNKAVSDKGLEKTLGEGYSKAALNIFHTALNDDERGEVFFKYALKHGGRIDMGVEEWLSDKVRFKTVYHGSGADFKKFDHAHMGEGEGSQYFGWGTYVTEVEGIAKTYAIPAVDDGAAINNIAEGALKNHDGNKDKAIEELNQLLKESWSDKKRVRGAIKVITTGKKAKEAKKHLYSVDIPDNNGSNYLDWDNPVEGELKDKIVDGYYEFAKPFIDEILIQFYEEGDISKADATSLPFDKGSNLYHIISHRLGGDKEASQFLSSIGLDGIVYPADYFNGGNAEGKKNYVIFDERNAEIVDHIKFRISKETEKVNEAFNSLLSTMTEENADSIVFGLGEPSKVLVSAGVENKPMKLYGSKVVKKMKKHGFSLEELRDLPIAIADPIAVFDNLSKSGNRSVLTELKTADGNFLVSLNIGKGNDIDFNIVSSVFGKGDNKVVNWINKGYATYINKEKALDYLHLSAPIAEASDNQGYLSATNIVKEFDNPTKFRASQDDRLWDGVKESLSDALAENGINARLSQSEAKWLVYQSANRNNRNNPISAAERRVVEDELGFSPEIRRTRERSSEALRFRINEKRITDSAASLYNEAVLSAQNRLTETWVDQFQAVNDLVAAIEKTSGKKAQSFEDVRKLLNQQSSRGLEQMLKWQSQCWNPLTEIIKEICDDMHIKIEDVERYMMLKHGLERNEKFAARDAREYYEKERDAEIAKVKNDDKLSDDEKDDAIDKLNDEFDQHVNDIEAKTDKVYLKMRDKDYSGLTGLYTEYTVNDREAYPTDAEFEEARKASAKPMYKTVQEMEDAAQDEIDQFEADGGVLVSDLWRRVNAATKSTLKHQYESNMLSRDQYQNITSMFDYYVPLRGFSESTDADLYNYYTTGVNSPVSVPVRHAKGRTTMADGPLGVIGQMASSAIAMDVKNDTRLALYFFVSNRKQDAVTIGDVWYVHDDMTDTWEEKLYPFNENLHGAAARQAYEDWEDDMKDLEKQGKAMRGGDKKALGYVIQKNTGDFKEHQIKVRVAGREKVMYINGNPRAAQAINGLLNLEGSQQQSEMLAKFLRYMSSISTSYNPEFWISNAQRDFLFAMMSMNVKGGLKENAQFMKNLARATTVIKMLRDNDNGTLGHSELENHYRDFAENGGITGYTVVQGNDFWEDELKKAMKEDKKVVAAAKSVGKAIMDFGEGIEQMTRFAAYLTARENGKNIVDAVNDAKELTVNFNRKGSGLRISNEELKKLNIKGGTVGRALFQVLNNTANFGRNHIMFFNAAVQGCNAVYKLYKSGKVKTLAWAVGYFALGALNALLQAMLNGGDDDDYLDIPDHERRSNLLMRIGKGEEGGGIYLSWALPQECRMFFGMGDLLVNKLKGRRPDKDTLDVIGDVVKMITDISPIDPLGGWRSFSPAWLTPVIETFGENKDFTGSPIAKENKFDSKEKQENTPGYLQVYPGTSAILVNISKVLNKISGGDETQKGKININPAKVEHLIESYTGGTGKTIANTYKSTIGLLFGEDYTVRNTPFLRRLLKMNDERSQNSYAKEMTFYFNELADNYDRRIKEYDKLIEDNESLPGTASAEGNDESWAEHNKAKARYEKDKKELEESGEHFVSEVRKAYKSDFDNINKELKADDGTNQKEIMRRRDALRKEYIKDASESYQRKELALSADKKARDKKAAEEKEKEKEQKKFEDRLKRRQKRIENKIKKYAGMKVEDDFEDEMDEEN